jgi:hypothetical protein
VILVKPVAIPLTIPVIALIVAIAGVLLAHAPPAGALVWAIVALTHTAEGPLMGEGAVLTVIVRVVLQPVGRV